MSSCELCEIFKNTCFVKHLRTAVSVYCWANINLEKSLLVRNLLVIDFPVGNYVFKVNSRNTRTRREINSKLTIKTLERRQCSKLTYFTPFSSVGFVNFEQVDVGWICLNYVGSMKTKEMPWVVYEIKFVIICDLVYKWIFIHSYLMICVRTTKDGRCKTKIRDALASQKPSLHAAEVLLLLWK